MRQIAQEEMRKQDSASRFGLKSIPNHTHNGVDSLAVKQSDIVPSVSVSGNINFAQNATYTIHLNSSFTPSHIEVYGNVVGNGTERFITFGSANLTPSFYLQPDTSTSVVTGNIQYPFIDPNLEETVPLQSSIYFGAEGAAGALHTLSSEGHVINVAYPAITVHARATITGFSRNAIFIIVELDNGWEINANYVIT